MSVLRSWAEISGEALRHNLRVIRKKNSKQTEIIAVVKANAYGHGMVPVAQECLKAGIEKLAVTNVEEGIILRKKGITVPILLFSPSLTGEMEEAIRSNLILTLSSFQEGVILNKIALRLRKKAKIHFKIDTGMGRIGCWHVEAANELKKMETLSFLKIQGIYTHFASSDDNEAMTLRQWKSFVPFRFLYPNLFLHTANSHALFLHPRFAFDGVRPGIMLYGAVENKTVQAELRQVMTWKSRIVLLRRVPAGRTVSYGATYRLPKAQTLATLAVGYADGYRRLLSHRASVLIGGKRSPVRGRVTMDQIVVDVSRVPNVKVGDEAVLLGAQGKEKILAEEMAQWAETISYEIFTGVGSRVARLYSDFKSN